MFLEDTELVPKKARTLDQLSAMKDKAVRFVRDVVGDPERAEEFEAMSPEEYAERKHIEIKNPPFKARFRSKGARNMPSKKPTTADLQDRIDDLETENEILSEKLDSILDIATEDDSDDDDDSDEDGDDAQD